MRTHLVALIALSLGLVACDDPNPALSATADSVQMGTGEEEFAVVPDGTVLSTVFGGQGGSHVWGAMRFDGFSVSGGPPVGGVGMVATFGVDHPEGPIAGVGPVTATVNAATGEYLAATLFVNIGPNQTPFLYPPGFSIDEQWPTEDEWEEIQEYLDAQVAGGLRLWVSVEDGDGNVLQDERTIGLQGLHASDISF